MARVWVSAYTKSDGTFVKGYWRDGSPSSETPKVYSKEKIVQLWDTVNKLKAGNVRREALYELARITGGISKQSIGERLDFLEPRIR